MDIAKQYRELLTTVLISRYKYYVLSRPDRTDAGYDELEQELFAIEKANPELTSPESPSRKPGSDNPTHYPENIRRFAED